MSASSTVTEATSNKVLPGDKSGLPWELWQIIFSWLSAADLCHVSCVCKTWAELVTSVDSTRWKELYLACSEWHHPFWPLNTNKEPPSWRLAYQDQYISTKFWCQRQKSDTNHVTCTALFKKNILPRNIQVGPGLEHESLRSALSVANDYDRIVVHPGIYDEQFEILAKTPFELIGHGELGSVILVMGVKQLSTATRISNLVLRAPWFTSFIININSGHLQVDNCIVEDGIICAKSPSTVHIRFCTFRHASVILQHMNASIIENCEFSQSSNANVFIEGHSKGEKNWAYSFLKERTKTALHQKFSQNEKKIKSTSSLTPTVHSSFTAKSLPMDHSGPSCETISWCAGFSFAESGENSLDVCLPGSHYIGLERCGVLRGGDLQSRKQESVTDEQLFTKSVTSADQKKTSENQNVDYNTSSYHSENELCNQHRSSQNSQNVSGILKQTINNKTVQSDSVPRNGTARRSLDSGKKSLHSHLSQELCEDNSVKCIEEKHSFEDCNSHNGEFHEPNFDSLKNSKVYSESLKHSSCKKSDRRKSVESHVGFHHDETVSCYKPVSDSEPGDDSVLGNAEKHSRESETENVFFQPSNLAGSIADLPFLPVGAVPNITKKGKQSKGPPEAGRHTSHDNNHRDEPVNQPEQSDKKPETVSKSKGSLFSESPEKKNIDQLFPSLIKEKSLEKENLEKRILKNHCDKKGKTPTETDCHRNKYLSADLENANCSKFSAAQITDISKLRSSENPGSVSPVTNSLGATSTQVNENNKICDDITNSVSHFILSASTSARTGSGELDMSCIKNEDNTYDLQGLKSPDQGHPSGSNNNHHQPFDASHHNSQHFIRRSQSEEILMESDDDLSILDETGDSAEPSGAESDDYGSSSQSTDSSDDEEESRHFTITDEEFSSGEESVIMLPHLHEFHIDHLDNLTSPRGVDAEVASINSECTKPVPVDIHEDAVMSSYADQIHGCLIHQCRMNHSKGGLMISLQAQASVSECDISNVGYGIRCIQNSKAIILRNKIHHCQTSGIFLRLGASGLIAGNDIHSNSEAGIDIRKNADPLVLFNKIHHGKRSGIVVLGSGQGQIKRNNIFNNTEAGVYVLYGGNPLISENYIYEGRAAGVAINAGGKGCIVHNVIRANQWAGVDIRNGSQSLVVGNSIINGMSDGIVVGLDGKGSIENNLISGNAGCGIWVMAAQSFSVCGNQICNNRNCGVMLLDKSTCMTNSMESQMDQFLTDVSQKTYCQYIDRSSTLETIDDLTVLQYNNIYCNKGQGILVEINKRIKLLYNTVHANQKEGILMANDASAVIEGNSVTSNGGSGIVTSTCDKTHLIGNGIYDNAQHGVVCRNSCVVDQNDIVGNQMYAVIVRDKEIVQVTQNRLCSSAVAAVKGEKLSVITTAGNVICDRGGGDFSCSGTLSASENVLVRPESLARKSGKTEFTKSDFLTDPPPRPYIPPPPATATTAPSHNVSTVTKVMVSSRESCEQGSKLCVIL